MKTADLGTALTLSLSLSLPHDSVSRSGSVAQSQTGELYSAGEIHSQTHLLDIPSELAALVRAVHNNDPLISQVHTQVTDPSMGVSPLVLKILADHSARTGIAIHYTIRDLSGQILYDIADVQNALPFYKNRNKVLTSIIGRVSVPTTVILDTASGISVESQLRTWALAGQARNFPTRDGASGYGASILTASGKIYYGGQYSTFEHRLGVHAEMGVLLNALMDGVRDITHLGIVSSKFPDTPCSICGCCRQFIGELSHAFNMTPTLCLFASQDETFTTHAIEELLPVQWTNKR